METAGRERFRVHHAARHGRYVTADGVGERAARGADHELYLARSAPLLRVEVGDARRRSLCCQGTVGALIDRPHTDLCTLAAAPASRRCCAFGVKSTTTN